MSNRTILVTGANGFVGRKTSKALKSIGMPIIESDLVSDAKSATIEGDYEYLNLQNLKDSSLDVIHIAARNNIRHSYQQEKAYIDENFEKFVRFYNKNTSKFGKIIYLSSCSVYSANASSPIDVAYDVDPISPYSKSKYLLEQFLVENCKRNGIACACFRTFNVVGSSQFNSINANTLDRIFPSITSSIVTGGTFKVHGGNYPTADGTCVRDYIHVDDLVELLILALENTYREVGIYNAGTGRGVSVLDCLNDSERLIGKKIDFCISERRLGDVAYRVADISRTTFKFGWAPKVAWHKILEDVYSRIRPS